MTDKRPLRFPEFFREERQRQNLTQEQLAEKLSIDVRTVREWESGKHVPRLSYREELCKALNKTPAELGLLPSENGDIRELVPSEITTRYTHQGKTHECKVDFTLTEAHSVQYTFTWHGFRGDRFTLLVDNLPVIDTHWQFLGIKNLNKTFAVEKQKGSFIYNRLGNRFQVIITIGANVLFEKEDGWNS